MTFVVSDRVQETCAAPGTGVVTLLGASSGYQSFSSGIGANNTTYYTIVDQSGTNWEVGLGTVGATGLTLTRTTVLSSSNSGSLVNFSVGVQNVWGDYPAGKAVYQDSIGTVTVPQLATNSTTSTTPVLSFNASNSGFSAGASISGNYLQTILQNKSGTAGASTNYVLSNNLGTDSSYYGEFGMNSSVFSASTPTDFFSINNGVYFSGHDGDITFGSGNGYKSYFAWGTLGQSAHVINASGALGFSTNLGTTPALSGTTGYGTAGQVPVSGGSGNPVAWSSTPTLTGTNFSGIPYSALTGTVPTWNQNTTGTAANVTGTVAVANGGTGLTSNFVNGIVWQAVQTSNFTASAGNGYPINSTSGSITVTLPASPSAGQMICLTDYAGTAATNKITINPNGNKFGGSTANAYLVQAREAAQLVYIDSTQGWIPFSAFNETSSLNISANYLIVAGGGGGTGNVAGGGAGGFVTGTATLTAGSTYTITVGAGGSAGGNGSNSSITGLTTAIGGGGGATNSANAQSGGSGGGGSDGRNTGGAGTSGQGNAGGSFSSGGGGGGGAGAAAANGTSPIGSAGGAGLAFLGTYYAGGGGGAWSGGGSSGGNGGGGAGNANANAFAGSANTGGGGGGAYTGSGGAGGSGIVIMVIPTALYSGNKTGTSTVTINGSNTIITWTGSGSYTA